MITKAEWRATLRARRQAIPPAERLVAAQKAATALTHWEKFKISTHIALYHAVGGEFPTLPLFHACWAAQKITYLPIVKKNGLLTFARFDANTPLLKNTWNILEPQETQRIDAQALDLLLLPLVGFDKKGNRLGAGGGYYDRLLKSLESLPVFALGVGYSCQEVERLPKEPQDQPIQGVLTEQGIRLWY